MRNALVIDLAVFFGLAFLVASLGHAAEPEGKRAAELVRLVRQDCGSCHGLTLQGGLGPALTPAALRGKPVEALKLTLLQGRPGTAMPGWARFMSEIEAEWIVGQLQTGFPWESDAAR
jgi:cytochrome c55X